MEEYEAGKLFVGNLPWAASESDLRELLERFGGAKRATVVIDDATGRSKGYGFVEMQDASQLPRAIEALNGSDLQGRRLIVDRAKARSGGRNRR